MADHDSLNLMRVGAHATYRPHAFYMRVSSWFDLDPTDGQLPPAAVAFHAHEYMHYLHNVTTCSGLHLFVANLWMLRSMAYGTDLKSGFRGENNLTSEQSQWIPVARTWWKALWGTYNWADAPSSVASWRFGKVHAQSIPIPHLSGHTVDTLSVELDALDARGRAAHALIDIGYNFISEGVAYEVERELRRIGGQGVYSLDDAAAPYPYLAFRQLVDYWVGRETSARERIDLGVISMLTTSPAATLFEVCERLKRLSITPSQGAALPEEIMTGVVAPFRESARAIVEKTARLELDALSLGGPIRDAASQIFSLFAEGFALRVRTPVLEQLFLEQHLTPKEYKERVGGLIDCCVLQERPNRQGVLDWIGPGRVAKNDHQRGTFAAFQCAMHFAQMHFTLQRILATSELPLAKCPFSGVCPMQRAERFPEACDSTPWVRAATTPLAQPLCWYAKGVRALARS